MSHYSVAETKNQLSELIDRALKGEGVVITRHGHPVVELRSIAKAASPVTGADLDWLRAHRVGTCPTLHDAATLLSDMRDEDER
jgi:prevent-host-death family protein